MNKNEMGKVIEMIVLSETLGEAIKKLEDANVDEEIINRYKHFEKHLGSEISITELCDTLKQLRYTT